ncbi:NADH-quinone oxidoreductase subunit K [candidate division LCP-89 bacterium B3_LCP]|uniref:NADH-quinone oxidoreductase subunit K n=1 Tax=candidate division LCP-89 bacterium B3_LCP TaxID=2012998 RepID=A0A532V5V6_UNCL8|nr:MAG: NADH-quinone oxidoreductase subunit K [candidate division LCP-89 bacterium B3_LCP]
MIDNFQVYLAVGVILFCLGLLCVMTRKSAISVLMGVELILNSAALNFVVFSKYTAGNLLGQGAAIFIIILAAAEAAVALAIFLNLYRTISTAEVNRADQLRG